MKETRLDVTTKVLLVGGIVAGPLYLGIGVAQALTRDAFDLTRHSWSLLANGDYGWIQILNFVVSGALVVGAAAGVRRVLKGTRGGTWGPVMLGLFGLGLIASGVFVADPMNGFPPGTPAGPPVEPTVSGLLHILVGSIGFAGFIGACFTFARRSFTSQRRGWNAYSNATGIIFLTAFLGVGAGSNAEGPVLQSVTVGFTVAVVLCWLWIALLMATVLTRSRRDGGYELQI